MKKILVIRFSALGDVAMLVPVVRAAAAQCPDMEFTVLSQQRMADLFADMPDNVVFHGVDLKHQSLREIADGLGCFDYVADMHGVWRSLYIRMRMRMRGARVKTIHKGRFSKFLLTHGICRKQLIHTSLRYVRVLRGLGITNIGSEDFFSMQNKGEGKNEKKGIGIAPFAAHKGKVYPIKQMEKIVAELSRKGEPIVLFGSKEEAAILNQWASTYKGVECVAGRMTLREEIERMRGLRVMLSMDSANMHLASIAGTRVVSIWGATHPYAGFSGLGQQTDDCIQRALRCRPCSIYGNKKCRYGDYRCMAIPPEEIIARLG